MNLKKNPELVPLIEWWEKDGKSTVLWVVIAALAVGGFYGWKGHRAATKAAASDAVVNAYTTEEIEDAVAKFGGTDAGGALPRAAGQEGRGAEASRRAEGRAEG